MPSAFEYTGHAGNGGLQRHSIGDEYPYMVVGTQQNCKSPTKWYTMDLRTGARGILRHSYKEAEIDLWSLKTRNMMHG